MKGRLSAAVAVLGFAFAVGAVSAWAVIPLELHVRIPFEFIVGQRTMPAGEYTISNPGAEAQDVIEVRSADGRNAVFVTTEPASPKGPGFVDKSQLIFRKIDGKEHLVSVWEADTYAGNAIPITR
jgi:hypothetical protein